jgi:hypothetical protein
MQVSLHIARLVALRLSPRSNGNGNGAARADVVTAALEADFDREAVYANALTSTVLAQAKMPMVMPDERSAIQAVVKTCGAEDVTRPRMLRIPNTLHLEYFYASEAMLPELRARPGVEVLGPLREMRFDAGRLVDGWEAGH